MRFPLSFRVARACALATLLLSLGPAPSFAHMGAGPGPAARPGPGFDRSPHFAARGFNQRSEAGRSGFNRFALNRFHRFGRNPLFAGGGWGWGGQFPAAASAPIVVGESAPVIINIGADQDPGDAGGALTGGCVVHKLIYDRNGKYVGERQIPHC
jgi:hypothetical protein